jgi:tetratricopeptide (TPR) repeat protein
MAYKIRPEHQKIRPLDQELVLSRMDQVWLYVEQHRREVLIGALLACLAAALVVGVVWYDRHRAEALMELDRQATKFYLDRPADHAKADENLKQAIALFKQATEQYADAPGAPLLLFKYGNALVQANDLKGAAEAYQRFITKFGSNKVLLGMVYQRLGYVHLLNRDSEQAIKAFSSLLDVPGALNKDQGMFELGKIEEARSRPEGALARYQDLMKTYPNSPFAGEASVRIKALEAKKSPAVPSVPTAAAPAIGAPPLAAPPTPAPAPAAPSGK